MLKSTTLRATEVTPVPIAVVVLVGKESPSVIPVVSDIDVADVPSGKSIG